jgi:hypothetical protein
LRVLQDRLIRRATIPINRTEAILINQRRAFQGLDNILWSPRFSFAWQPLGVKHGTVLRGGIGVFYDSVDSVASSFSNNPPLLNGFTVTGDVLSFGEQNSLFDVAKNSNKAFVDAFWRRRNAGPDSSKRS